MSAGIVVGYDGSDCAKAALSTAADIAKRYGEALIIAFAYEVNRVAGEVGDYHHALQDLAQTRLQEAAALVGDSGLEVDAVIIVGTRGERPLHAALIGSTPQKLVHMSGRPVLVAPMP
jgi:nucleotide-binding universal stress UspA family protein